MKYRFFLSLSFFFLIYQSQAQNIIEGTVAVSNSKDERIPFVSFLNRSNSRVYISNENGVFLIDSTGIDKDFIVSCVGYNSTVVKMKRGVNNVRLNRNITILNEVEVAAKSPNYLLFLNKALKNYTQKKTEYHKCFMNLKTTNSRSNLVELVQAYYNLKMDDSHIIKSELKTAKIGIGKSNNFLTVDYTNLLNYFSLTGKNDTKILWPGNFSSKAITRAYNIRGKGIYLQDRDTIIIIEFIPKSINKPKNFSATVYINKRTYLFEKLIIYNKFNNNVLKLIRPIFPGDSIGKVDFKINIDFANKNSRSLMSKIAINYSLDYKNDSEVIKYTTKLNAFVIGNGSYYCPLPKLEDLNDYQRVLAQPVNNKFWDYNIVFPDIAYEFNEFVKQNKVLNLSDSLVSSLQIINPEVTIWSNKIINNQTEVVLDSSINKHDQINFNAYPSYRDLVYIDVKIWMDINDINESKEILLATIYNKGKSYYLIKENENNQMYLSTVFNIGEKYKRKLLGLLIGVNEIDHILKLYNENNKSMEKEIHRFNQSTIYGTVKQNLVDEYNAVQRELMKEE